MAGLALVAGEVAGPGAWLWRLLGPGGELVASHVVAVDTSAWEWRVLRDLTTVAGQADPTDRLGSEAALVERVGRWTAEHVLGPIALKLAEEAPVAVSVVAPGDATWLLGLPLGVAWVGERPLAASRVAFAGSVEGQLPVAKDPVAGRLRVLAVFSVPTGQTLLDLRRERKGLAQLVGDLVGGGDPRAVELRVLQYGATAGRLRDALAEGEGWDVVHFAGHGQAGRLVLEDAAGKPDVVGSDELVEWLRDARHRLKLVTLSACSSAAFTVAQTLVSLGVDAPDVSSAEGNGGDAHALALEVLRRAECTVVAMRYPVVDDYAIAFGLALFDALWRRGMDSATATAWAVQRTAAFPPTPGAPALSAYTPAVFGPAAPALRLDPPARGGGVAADTRMERFDPEPPRFVGRIGAMTRANAALAPASGRTGVVFHGMAGAGKTACALELAYGQRENFSHLLWCRPEGDDPALAAKALADLAGRLDLALGVAVADKVHDLDRLAQAAPTLTEAMEQRSVLVVLDNAESLLSPGGNWLDDRWGALVAALVNHGGRGRLVVTSRRPPATLPPTMVVEAVHALSRDEAVLLARQLPNLARVLADHPLPTRDGPSLARAVLEATGGHPKLMELADAHATDAGAIEAMLAQAQGKWQEAGVDPAAFLAGAAAPDDPVGTYLALLGAWATQALAGLEEAALLLAQLLCRAEGPDRTSAVVENNWAYLWRRLGRPDPAPDHGPLLRALTDAALVEATTHGDTDPEAALITYTVHPAVAETVAAATPTEVAAAADTELAAFWNTVLHQAMEAEAAGEATTRLVAHAARRAAAYLVRLGKWGQAAAALENAVRRDPSPGGQAEAATLLRRIAEQVAGTDDELSALGILAKALMGADPAEAERLMVRVEAEAAAAARHQIAGAVAGDLASLLQVTGRLRPALDVLDRKAAHTARTGLGPWTQLTDRGRRLQVLQLLGENEQVLADAAALVEEMGTLPDPPGDNESVAPWNVREATFTTAFLASRDLRRWDEALEWLGRVSASEKGRGASELERVRTAFNSYAPLLRTGRTAEAGQVLAACRAVFEREGAFNELGQCLSAQADLEDKLGHRPQAVELEHIALRFEYLVGEPGPVAISHFNLASYLDRLGEVDASVAHRLAAVVLTRLTASGLYGPSVAALGRQLARGTAPPATFAEVCAIVERVDGVAFGALVERLGGDGDELLATVVGEAQALASAAGQLASWEPALALLVAAGTNPHARAHLDETLARKGGEGGWADLVARLERVRDGERDADALTASLDVVDRAVVHRSLEALGGTVTPDPVPEPLRSLADAVVTLARDRRRAEPPVPDDATLAAVAAALDSLEAMDDWSALAVQMRRLAEGGTAIDWDGLDATDTAIACTLLGQIEEPTS